jgi:transposase
VGAEGEARPGGLDLPAPGEQAGDYSAVCPETGEVAHRELAGTSPSATSTAFRRQLRANHPEPLIVLGDNGPAHSGAALCDHLATPGLALRALRLPPHRPDCNPDEAIRARARAEVAANACLGTKAKAQEQLAQCFAGLPSRTAEVQSRRRRTLQALAETVSVPTPAARQEAPR